VPQEEEEDYYENKKIRVAYGRSLKYIEYSVLVVVVVTTTTTTTTMVLRFECF
jgi:hypothetical protein